MKDIGNVIVRITSIAAITTFAFSIFLLINSINRTTTVALTEPIQSESFSSTEYVDQKMNEFEGKVLGATDKSKCLTDKEYLKALVHARPELAMYFGTDVKELKASQLVTCAETLENKSESTCSTYTIALSPICVEKLFVGEELFPTQYENLRSSENGKTVSVRIKDAIVDYLALTKLVIKTYEENSEFEKVAGIYATVKPLAVQVPVLKNTPNTDGKLAARYIEFDGSRQLMFLWEKGKYKMFRMSGAFPEYNPVGVFSILNKSPLAWSSTASKWMPYWQAFTYDKKQQAMLGIHALVYWYPGFEKTGAKRIYEPESNIGKPRSTGCLRFTIQDAKRIFEWSRVGDLVIVHD